MGQFVSAEALRVGDVCARSVNYAYHARVVQKRWFPPVVTVVLAVLVLASAITAQVHAATTGVVATAANCAVDDPAPCATDRYCAGINTGFFNSASLDKPFIDQSRGAAIEVRGYQPNDLLRNADIPTDANKYPTDVGRLIFFRFYLHIHRTFAKELVPSGRYVVLWDGAATRPRVRGENVSNLRISERRIEFSLDASVRGGAWFQYENTPNRPHVRNIRIVPIEYEVDYKNWSWSRYEVGAATNPPIFFDDWLDKMSSGCVIRYMNSNGTNDLRAVELNRDSSKTRIKPSSSSWYEGHGLGPRAEERHQFPWELMVEATLQTKTTPWINFRVMTYENLVGGDPFVGDIATLFFEHYGGPIYVEYGNEIWNFGFPFFVATNHIRDNGPGVNNDLEENYSLRNNAIQKAFAEAYGDKKCLAMGVVSSQGRNSFRGRLALGHADRRYVDVLSPGMYVGDDIAPGGAGWEFIAGIWRQVDSGTITLNEGYLALKNEILTGEAGVILRNFRNDIRVSGQQYVDLANQNNMCMAVYEMGLHIRVDNDDVDNSDHRAVVNFLHQYKRSVHQAAVEREMHTWLSRRITGPAVAYASFMKDAAHAFSYWDSPFENRYQQPARASLIRYYRDNTGPIVRKLDAVDRKVRRLPARIFKSPSAKVQMLSLLEQLRKSIDTGEKPSARRAARRVSVRADGCGARADRNDLITHCPQQRVAKRAIDLILADINRLM